MKQKFKIGDRVILLGDVELTNSTIKKETIGVVCCFYPIGYFGLIGVDFSKENIGLHDLMGALKTQTGFFVNARKLKKCDKILKIKEWLSK